MIKILTFHEFKTQIENNSVQLLDVRTELEYELGKIKDASLLNVQSPEFEDQARQSVNLDEPVYLYCRAGVRSQLAAKILENLGASEIYDLEGGYLNWIQNSR